MAGTEFEQHPIYDVPPINKQPDFDFGKTYDGADRQSSLRYGVFYSPEEIELFGKGNKDIALKMIGDAILADTKDEEYPEVPDRPYNEEIQILENRSKLH